MFFKVFIEFKLLFFNWKFVKKFHVPTQKTYKYDYFKNLIIIYKKPFMVGDNMVKINFVMERLKIMNLQISQV